MTCGHGHDCASRRAILFGYYSQRARSVSVPTVPEFRSHHCVNTAAHEYTIERVREGGMCVTLGTAAGGPCYIYSYITANAAHRELTALPRHKG